MNFKFLEDSVLTTNTDSGINVDILFYENDIDVIYFGEHEFLGSDDAAAFLKVAIGGVDYTLASIALKAQEAYPKMAEQRILDEAEYERECALEDKRWNDHVRGCMAASRFI